MGMRPLQLWLNAALVFGFYSMAQVGHAQSSAGALADVQVRDRRSEVDPDPAPTYSSTRLSAKELQVNNTTSLVEAAQRVPGLTAYGSTARSAGFNIRGLGNNQFNDGMDSGTSLYVDGVYLARQTYGALTLFDLEELQVYRGPQGARYGLDTTTGEIHLRTRLPSFTRQTDVTVSAGNFGYTQIAVSTTGALVPGRLAGRLSLFGQAREGLLINQFDGSDLNNQHRLGVRGQLVWLPRSDWVVRAVGEYGVMDQRCCAAPLLAPVSPSVQASDDYMGYRRVGTNPYDRVADNDVNTHSRVQRQSFNVIAEYSPNARHRWVSITGHNALKFAPSLYDDGTSLRLVTGSLTSQSRQFTQELRWHTRFNRADSTVGFLFLQQQLQGREFAVLGDQVAQYALGGALRERVPGLTRQNSGFLIDAVLPPQALNGLELRTPYQQSSSTGSLFGTLDFKLTEQSTLSTGLRWTGSRRTARISRDRSGGNLDSSPLALTNALASLGGVLGPNVNQVTYDGLVDSLVGAPFDRQDSRNDQALSGKLALSHNLSEQSALYVSIARGYKSGGINLAGLTRRVEPQFKPETATNTELGFRSRLSQLGIGYGVTIYNTRVTNFQALTHDEGDGLVANPRPNNVINIPKVRLRGIELELGGAVAQGLSLSAAVAYNQATSTVFPNAPNEDTGQNNKDLSGKQLYNAPRWSGLVSLERQFALAAGHRLTLGWDQVFRTGTFAAVDQSRSSFFEGYQLSNIRLGYRNTTGRWGVQAWVRNVFNTQYKQAITGLYSVGEYGGYAGDPRTYGVTLDFSLQQ